jgi:hypothetical protein
MPETSTRAAVKSAREVVLSCVQAINVIFDPRPVLEKSTAKH